MAHLRLEKELLNLSDGTTIRIARTPGMGDKEWQDTKKYLEANPEEARRMETFSRDAKAVRAWMQTQAITEYYNTRLSNGDEVVTNKFNSLEKNPDVAAIFEDIKRGGNQAAMQHYHNEPLMLKISRAMGGVPEEVKSVLQDIQNKPITLQEACLRGDMKTLEDYLEATASDPDKRNIDEKDAKGISCLGYAIGANRTHVVKKLLESKANPWEVDNSGGNAIHYAAAYGRKELLQYFISAKGDVNKQNTQGQTPLALAQKNKMKDAIDLLTKSGAK
ncbi:AKR2A [Symbiodinium pilosum]|uniref:AKR2A protein n=1 Tax=Symbiodinium pilosum TaxID=2952 RepID=A0A812LRJ7_SYMPI|nr:AKR2A [Symbiodinium pilosum]